MKNFRLVIFSLFFICLATFQKAEAKEVVVAVGFSVAPYIIQENNTGIELDIIREALAYKGHTLKTTYIPFIEIDRAFVDRKVDAIATVEEKIGIDGYFSDHVVTYENYAISLAKNHLKINKIDDLKDKSVAAFQMATKYLGSEYAEMAKSNPQYREKEERTTQIKLLYDGRMDAVIIDKNIFHYYTKDVANKVDVTQPLVYHNIFAPNKYKVVFSDKVLRDDFNAGLKHLRETGQYKEIFNKYLPNNKI